MYARVLYVSPHVCDESTLDGRCLEALRDAGHAVLPLTTSVPCARDFKSACSAFAPTVALVGTAARLDSACVDMLAELGVPVLYAREFLRNVAPDTAYQQARISSANTGRRGFCCTQARIEHRAAQIAAALESLGLGGDDGFVATDPSWPRALPNIYAGPNAAYYLRTTLFAVYFTGDDAPSVSELALRVAEGNLVLCEEGSLPADSLPPGFVDAFELFTADGLAQAIERDCTSDALADLRNRQVEALASLPPLELCLQIVLRDLDEHRRAAGKPPVLAYGQPAVSVGLYGWFGARNFGDDLLMNVAVDRVRAAYPNAYPWIVGADPAEVRSSFGYEAFDPAEKYQIDRMLGRSRGLVYCGGLIFDEPMVHTAGPCEFALEPWMEPSCQADIALMAAAHNVTPVFLGIGAGPLALPATQASVRLMGRAGSQFLCRDQNTLDLLVAAGLPQDQAGLYADLVLGARPYVDSHKAAETPRNLEPGAFFVVSMRRWNLNPPDFCARVAAALDAVAAATSLTPAFVPFDEDDASLHREIAQLMNPATPTVVFDERLGEADLFALIDASAFAFAMRLHCSILHHVLGKPALGFNYNDKIEAHFASMGELGHLVALDAEPTHVAQVAVSMHVDRAAVCASVAAHVAASAARVDAAFSQLDAIIDATEPLRPQAPVFYPRTVSATRQLLYAREREHAAEVEALRAEVEALRTSHSYRLGNLFMRIPAKLRRFFRRER